MDISWCVFVQWHGLKKNEVCSCLRGNFLGQINDLEDSWPNFKCVWIHMLAYLTLETFPIKWTDILVRLRNRLLLLLTQNPTLKALEMNETDWSFTFASNNQRIIFVLICAPADSALNMILRFIDVLRSLHFHGLSKLLLVEFLFGHLLLVTSEVFYPKSYSTEFDGIKLLNFIVILSVFVLERSCN